MILTVWTLHIDDDDTFETTLHRSREDAVRARRFHLADANRLEFHPDDKDFTSDGDVVTLITEHVLNIPVDGSGQRIDVIATTCHTPSVTGLGDDILNAQRRWAGQVIEMGWEAGHNGIGYWARSMGHKEGPDEGDGIVDIVLVEWESALEAIDEAGGIANYAAKFTHKLTADALVTATEKVVKVLAPEAKDPDSWVCEIARLWSEDPEQLDDSIANMDAGLADCLIQYAVLGEVRYG